MVRGVSLLQCYCTCTWDGRPVDMVKGVSLLHIHSFHVTVHVRGTGGQ